MRRLLFVDDEPALLDGLRRMLRTMRTEWDMQFAASGKEALERLDAGAFDVVLSDMHMPSMDGATLLGQVRDRQPAAVRIVLSGTTEIETAIRSIPVAHQFLAKPCDADKLRETVDRAVRMRDMLQSDDLLARVSGLGTIPTPPKVYQALVTALADPEVELETVAAIVEQDIGVYAKVLQIANSSFLGLARTVHSVKEAIAYIGLDFLKRVVLGAEVFAKLAGESYPENYDFEAEQRHARLVAAVARRLLEDPRAAEDAFMAGMLHDIGRCLLASRLGPSLRKVDLLAARSPTPRDKLEQLVAGIGHAEAGAYLLGIWGLPYPIVEAVRFHHQPSSVGSSTFDVLGAVHVADALAHGIEGNETHGPLQLDRAYLEGCGVSARIEDWRELAREEYERAG